jgi:oligogalacturonide lyase
MFLALFAWKTSFAAEAPASDAQKSTPRSSVSPQTASNSATSTTQPGPPTDWIDPATGHRIIRLSQEPGTSSLYFHQNAYNQRGDKLFVTITTRPPGRASERPADAPPSDDAQPNGRGASLGQDNSQPPGAGFFPGTGSLAVIDLSTLGKSPPKVEKIADGFARGAVVSKKSGNVYYIRSELVGDTRVDTVVATNLDTHETREIGKLPFRGGSGLAVNADETLLAGSYAIGGGRGSQQAGSEGKSAGGEAEGKSGSADGKTNNAKSNGVSGDRPAEGRVAPPGDGGPGDVVPGGGNANSTPDSAQRQIRNFASRERSIAARFAAHQPMKLFTMDIKTGETNTFHPSTDWLNHVQFSQTDPQLMMFCHEGPWHQVDRIWTIHPGSDEARLMHPRTMPNEIAGHEFFGSDGKTIWYDLQTPRSGQFWLAGVNVDTGERLRYPIERSLWSVHYNQSHDGKLFAGDGGGPGSVANRTPLPENKPLDPPGNGEWIYLFTPIPGEMQTMQVGGETVKVGKFKAEKLVDMSKHNYEFEPNLTFTPDDKWIVFRSNMHGPVHTYAVEIAKAQ